ncbi:MAG: hypothetical protein HQK97_09245 [Nitrospirae bacterium]|nr:hypothetical protein [Nitrospirota bacterium]
MIYERINKEAGHIPIEGFYNNGGFEEEGMVKLEEITSFVSSFIDRLFGAATIWPRVAEDVRKTSLNIIGVMQSVYDTSVNVIFGQDKKCNIQDQPINPHPCHGTPANTVKLSDDSTHVKDQAAAPEALKAEPPADKPAEPEAKDTSSPTDASTPDATTNNAAAVVESPAPKPRAKKRHNPDSSEPANKAVKTPRKPRTPKPKV